MVFLCFLDRKTLVLELSCTLLAVVKFSSFSGDVVVSLYVLVVLAIVEVEA